MVNESWMPAEKHKYIIEHCKCTARIANYLYFNRCGVHKNILTTLALMHDCLKFASVKQSYIEKFGKEFPNLLFGNQPENIVMSHIKKSSAHSAYPKFDVSNNELPKEEQNDIVFRSIPDTKSMAKCNIVFCSILPYYHNTEILDTTMYTLLDIVALTHMVSPNFSKQIPSLKFFELNLAIAYIYKYLLQPTQKVIPIDRKQVEIIVLLICICDILDACTKQSGDTNTLFDKQPIKPIDERNRNFSDTINKIISWLSQPCMRNLYAKNRLETICYRLKQLNNISYENLEKDALKVYYSFDIEELQFE